jgi:chemotaxis protein CheD
MAVPVSDDAPGDADVSVSVADSGVSAGGCLRTSGLGSCLGVALYDPEAGVGALLHPMLPFREDETRRRERYVDSGIAEVLGQLEATGADRDRIVARVVGGAAVVEFGWNEDDGGSIGQRNVAAAEEVLDEAGIDIVGREVGGEHGRSMRFDTVSGEVTVERTDGERTVL